MKKILLLSTAMFLLSIAIFAQQEPDGKYCYIVCNKINEPDEEGEMHAVVSNIFYIDKANCNEYFIGLEFKTFVKKFYSLKGVKAIGYARSSSRAKLEERRARDIRDFSKMLDIQSVISVDNFNPTCERPKPSE